MEIVFISIVAFLLSALMVVGFFYFVTKDRLKRAEREIYLLHCERDALRDEVFDLERAALDAPNKDNAMIWPVGGVFDATHVDQQITH